MSEIRGILVLGLVVTLLIEAGYSIKLTSKKMINHYTRKKILG